MTDQTVCPNCGALPGSRHDAACHVAAITGDQVWRGTDLDRLLGDVLWDEAAKRWKRKDDSSDKEGGAVTATTTRTVSRWARLPLHVALGAVAAVWVIGCVWSFTEQTGYATSKGFRVPQLLPLVIDGLAVSLAAVAWAASLDGRPAVFARLATMAAIAGSASSNGAFAWERSADDPGTVALAVAVPVAANLAFEVLLAELRRQVLRHRGLPAPVAVPMPRLLRVGLAPWSTFWTWRRLVLQATDLVPLFAAAASTSQVTPEPAAVDTAVDTAPVTDTDTPQVATLTRPRTSGRTRARTSAGTAKPTDTAKAIARIVAKVPDASADTIAAKVGVSARTVRRHLADMNTDTEPASVPVNGHTNPDLLPTGSQS